MRKSIKRQKKIIWILVGNPKIIASSRIHGLRVHEKLIKNGYNSVILYIPSHTEEVVPLDIKDIYVFVKYFNKGDIVFFQKIKNDLNEELFQKLFQKGVTVVLIDCDLPLAKSIINYTSKIITTSHELAKKYSFSNLPVKYIEDSPEEFFFNFKKNITGCRIKCYWFGIATEERWKEFLYIRDLIQNCELKNFYTFTSISNHQDADIKWDEKYIEKLKEADLVIIPIIEKSESTLVKSANRVLQSMALSIPVFASTIESYNQIIQNGYNGYLCDCDEEWREAFERFKDYDFRTTLSANAYKTATSFDISKNIKNWIDFIKIDDSFKARRSIYSTWETKRLKEIIYKNLIKKSTLYWNAGYKSVVTTFFYLKRKCQNTLNFL